MIYPVLQILQAIINTSFFATSTIITALIPNLVVEVEHQGAACPTEVQAL